MFSKVISTALIFLAASQVAVAIACGDPPLPACPSFPPPHARLPNFAATPWAASASKRVDSVPELGTATNLEENREPKVVVVVERMASARVITVFLRLILILT
ncbi:hypothetical protein B0H16DRAFT_1879871 [Mycena metata]|uniref:Secreted protein n=1 Tax=Mycena metata TaxID=1033252 RepID=A0AAD7NUR4_9AGAR|nr:hypothetical protein B0H16DRAFT_1879871 [Mycena metata]